MKTFFCGVAFAAFLTSPALAEDAPQEVVVTLTREPVALSKVGQSVSTFDAAAIERSQLVFLKDLIALTPSVSIAQTGGHGQAGTARFRGAESDRSLFIVDGVKLGDPSMIGGGLNLGLLALNDAVRVEILRGPLSTLWGSQAIGGVVSVTTRMPQAPFEAQGSIEGLDEYVVGKAGIGGKTGPLSWRLAASYIDDDGVSSLRGAAEKDGFTQKHLNTYLHYALSDTSGLRARLARTESEYDFDGYNAAFQLADTRDTGFQNENLASLGYYTQAFGSALKQTFTLSYSTTKRSTSDLANATTYPFEGRQTSFDYTGALALSESSKLVFGASSERSQAIASGLNKRVTLNGLFAQLRQEVTQALTVNASLRYDDHSVFGGNSIAQVAIAYALSPSLVLRSSLGQGFKSPSLYQLYDGWSGNLKLKPEEATNLDVGVDYHGTNDSRLGVSLFGRKTDNQIDYDMSSFLYGNIARTKAYGIELDGETNLTANVRLSGNYSHIVARDDAPSSATFRNDLGRAPRHLANASIEWQATDALELGASLRYAGKSFENIYNTRRLNAYTLLDLRASYALNETMTLVARVENATDEDYETAANYGSVGRRLWLGLRAKY
ncbi:TonB-dependent receptor plug domain-containing protein [Asticcacaulis excentricus]|uniref:TonB-dependent receptor n=1 Tax=Asticcacaulis excentricus (strain ATCC 15261 / DSM 4724 / KCTC 12464 / NCIMB 9791 / VKM B-1370 / CB 48) TaxID=573065 RepID=E8RR12_ASTEC|nr:TonB-dependent receptor [Asticcacaulis excentricus]ADU13330.1 TonB-dependent receptor [Asticcacaulis excentricus CB 48]